MRTDGRTHRHTHPGAHTHAPGGTHALMVFSSSAAFLHQDQLLTQCLRR